MGHLGSRRNGRIRRRNSHSWEWVAQEPSLAPTQAFLPLPHLPSLGASLGITFYILYSCFKKRNMEPTGFLFKVKHNYTCLSMFPTTTKQQRTKERKEV